MLPILGGTGCKLHGLLQESVRAVASGLMNELEAILHEYLSFNWDRVEEVLDSNRTVLNGVGLSVPWPSHPSLSVRSALLLCPLTLAELIQTARDQVDMCSLLTLPNRGHRVVNIAVGQAVSGHLVLVLLACHVLLAL